MHSRTSSVGSRGRTPSAMRRLFTATRYRSNAPPCAINCSSLACENDVDFGIDAETLIPIEPSGSVVGRLHVQRKRAVKKTKVPPRGHLPVVGLQGPHAGHLVGPAHLGDV